ncbi:HYR domain-containing protein [Dasania marina]|uniref:HYR domain-containing protein n=1 Tax=Dasania marina TaxID=471499 RepID=UPI0030DCCB4E
MRIVCLLVMLMLSSHQAMAAKGGKSGEKGGKDRAAPSIEVPAGLTVEAESAAGAVVSYTVTVSDNKDDQPSYSCSPASGALFPLATTIVTCTAADSRGNQSQASFAVNVLDSQPPLLNLPDTIQLETEAATSVAVDFQVSASDLVDGNTAVACMPLSGSLFSVGESSVQCNSVDQAGNTVTASFLVLVNSVELEPDNPSWQPSTITVNWQPPATRADGSPLPITELGGYDLYIVAETSGSDRVVNIANPTENSYVYSPEMADTYHFSIASYDSNGISSVLSNTVSVVIE